MGRRRPQVFINVPFDEKYERLYVALIAGLAGLDANPRCSLEVPTTRDRLRRVFNLLRSCDLSIHDLSRVQLSREKPRCPRFNMSFEAGLAVALFLSGSRKPWYILEEDRYRLLKSLSDLKGYEVNAHEGTPEGMLGVLLDIFPWGPQQPDPDALHRMYQSLRKASSQIKKENGNDLFRPRSFRMLRYAAEDIATRVKRETSSY